MPNIVEIAVSNDNFTTLVAAVQAAGLVEALQSPGPFTVFAPTDDAFAQLPPGTVQTLVQNPPQLARILKYHVVMGKLTQADLAQAKTVESLEGSAISINCENNVFEAPAHFFQLVTNQQIRFFIDLLHGHVEHVPLKH